MTAAIAFLLALFSHILNHVVIRLHNALYEKENPNKLLHHQQEEATGTKHKPNMKQSCLSFNRSQYNISTSRYDKKEPNFSGSEVFWGTIPHLKKLITQENNSICFMQLVNFEFNVRDAKRKVVCNFLFRVFFLKIIFFL